MQSSAASATQTARRSGWYEALAGHWPEYLMEAAELGLFMISACVFGALLGHPASPLYQAVASPTARRVLMGLAMGSTATAIICSPLGQRSGAHFNPSVTLTYLLLGKVRAWDAIFYVTSQFLGGILGVAVAYLMVGFPLKHPNVNYVVTVPGPGGAQAAFWAELLISFVLMSVILGVSNTTRLARFTPYFAGALVATYISVESPLSGMSMNPARTLGSAFSARDWTALWVYFTAPPLGMFLASIAPRYRRGAQAASCAKLHHHNGSRCIFRCNYGAM